MGSSLEPEEGASEPARSLAGAEGDGIGDRAGTGRDDEGRGSGETDQKGIAGGERERLSQDGGMSCGWPVAAQRNAAQVERNRQLAVVQVPAQMRLKTRRWKLHVFAGAAARASSRAPVPAGGAEGWRCRPSLLPIAGAPDRP